MQIVKSEWASLQTQFEELAPSEKLSHLQAELEALSQTISSHAPEPHCPVTESLSYSLRKIQRYVEWTVPDMVPERAEAAETLVNISRFSARLAVQEDWNLYEIKNTIAQQMDAVAAMRSWA